MTFLLHNSIFIFQFTLDGIQSIIKKCPRINDFLSFPLSIDDEIVKEIVQHWTELKQLVLNFPSAIQTETFEFMKEKCKYLESLNITTYQPKLTFAVECSMFEKITTLKTIRSANVNDGMRVMTRCEFYEQDTYLENYHMTYSPSQLTRGVKRVS